MREQLLGYLMGALEAPEHEEVEQRLKYDWNLQHDLELLHESLEPLRAGEHTVEPPAGLAARTSRAVALHVAGKSSSPLASPRGESPLTSASRWSLTDLVVAAGIFLAAGLLLLPAIQQSRVIAGRTGCQNNLEEIGRALQQFSQLQGGYFPKIPLEGPQSSAGIYAVRLLDGEFLSGPQWLVCPSANRHGQRDEEFHVPTGEQLQAAQGERLVQMQRSMGGCYGYSLGYRKEGIYRAVKNQGRATFAIMADMPNGSLEGRKSSNHGGCGQNVLYEDGHVEYLKSCVRKGCSDQIFINDEGLVAAGTHENDAVIGPSWSRPLLRSTSYGAK